MRIVVEVDTKNATVEDVTKAAFNIVRKNIEKRTKKCLQCGTPFLSERDTLKVYCKRKCRWDHGNGKSSNSTAISTPNGERPFDDGESRDMRP